jgi:hypothetical protein
VGKGAGAVASNTTVGVSALPVNTTGSQNTAVGNGGLYTNTTGSSNTAVGYFAGLSTSTGSNNTAIGTSALQTNTTASFNTAVGYQAGYTNSTGAKNVYIGKQAGYAATGSNNTIVGEEAGLALSTGAGNTFIGAYNSSTGGCGEAITTGSKNTILGAYNGNQGGLDIRTASNYIVLSDGDGNPRLGASPSGWFWANHGGATTPYYNEAHHRFSANVAQGTQLFTISAYPTANDDSIRVFAVSTGGYNAAAAAMMVSKNSSTNRSINAGGTINASGADYAEYMTKAGNFTVAKGDVVGINAEGKLTNVFADAVSFVVKSTDPSYVGGDVWGIAQPKNENNNPLTSGTEYDAWVIAQEAARQTVDRVAFAGQVPVNVVGATAGQYIIPVNNNGAIKGEAVGSPTFEQYQQAVGKVIAIEADGRARIIVKVA